MKTKKLTKRIVALIVSLLLIASIGCLVGCNNNTGKASGRKLSAKEFYGMGSVSTVQLLSGMQGSSIMTLASDAEVNADTTDSTMPTTGSATTPGTNETTEVVKQQALDFNKYFATLDNFLNEDNINVTEEANTSGEYADYAKKLTINCKDLSGATVQYVMYYNEVEDAATPVEANEAKDVDDVNDSDDVDEDDNDSETDNDNDNDNDNETEKYYTLNGVMVVDGQEYKLMGRRQVETETDETENEIMIRAYVDETLGNYVEMKHEASQEEGENEVEYVYSIYQGGVLVEETAIEFENETENDKTETEYTLEFRKGESKGVYTVEREVKANETEIKVMFNMDGKTGYFNIKEVDDGAGNKSYEYKFEDNSTVTFDKD